MCAKICSVYKPWVYHYVPNEQCPWHDSLKGVTKSTIHTQNTKKLLDYVIFFHRSVNVKNYKWDKPQTGFKITQLKLKFEDVHLNAGIVIFPEQSKKIFIARRGRVEVNLHRLCEITLDEKKWFLNKLSKLSIKPINP